MSKKKSKSNKDQTRAKSRAGTARKEVIKEGRI